MHQIVLAIDFDETMAEPAYPHIGAPKPNLSFCFKALKEKNYYIIIWTCREGLDVEKIKEWCIRHNILYDQINEHHPTLIKHYKNNTRKIMADVYIDDKCLFALPNNWADIYRLIMLRTKELHETKKCLNI